MTKGTVLILGGTGRFGRHATEAFWNAGWRVRLFDRASDDLLTAAQGADVIVNGWNPPYTRWASDLPGLTRQVIAAARACGSTVILPGNVYVYGRQAPELLAIETPNAAGNPLGQVRRAMEAAYCAADIQTILLRAGDFIDTEPSGNWFDRVIAARAAKGGFAYPGDPEVPHAWAFLPDLARAAVLLAERRAHLPEFNEVPFPGYTLTGRDLHRLCAAALGRNLALKRMSWLPLELTRPVWPMARHLIEMRYLWSMPHRLDSHPFDGLLPGFAATDPTRAIALALAHQIGPDQPVAQKTLGVPDHAAAGHVPVM